MDKKNINKILITIIFAFTIFIISPQNIIYAQENTEQTTTTETSDDTLNQILNQIDDDRIKELEMQLLLNLPLSTENPNHVVTFTDPSPSQKGVFLQIDGKDYKQITSPYTLPTLGIGAHTLYFKFHDKVETQQILERNIAIIPRTPQIKPPVVNGGNVTVSGTGIPTSQVEVLIFNELERTVLFGITDVSGNWSITLDKQLAEGKYTMLAIVRKNGFSSKFSETLGFEVGTNEITQEVTVTPDTKPIYFSFSQINQNNIVDTFKANPDLAYLLVGIFLFAIILTMFINLMFRNKENKKAEKLLKSVFSIKTNGSTTPQNVKQILIENLAKNGNEKAKKEEEKLDKNQSKKNKSEKKSNSEVEAKSEVTTVEYSVVEEKLEVGQENENELEEKEVSQENIVDEKKTEEKDSIEEDLEEKMEDKVLPDVVIEEKKEDIEKKKKKAIEEFENENKTITKEDFLMSFKDQDPDDDNGVEKSNKNQTILPKKEKRNIKISLTSKD